jgi:hypothetical protein
MTSIARSALSVTLAAGLALGPLACSEDRGSQFSLLAPTGPSEDAEVERLRQLQMVRVIHGDGTHSNATPEQVGLAFIARCSDDLQCDPNGPNCADTLCSARVSLCVANYMAEAADIRAAPLSVPLGADTVDIPPQSTATNSGLHHYAAAYAHDAIREAATRLETMLATASAGPCAGHLMSDEYANPQTGEGAVAYKFATVAADAYLLMKKEYLAAARESIAAGDAQLSGSASPSEGIRRAVAGSARSR